MLEFELEKRYGAFSLRVSGRVEQEWLVLLAPSGAGKSLTLNLISGIVQPDAGYVRMDGESMFDHALGVSLPIRNRRIGYLFQDYAVFPHLTVAANIAYGLPAGVDVRAAVEQWVRFFRLEGREQAFPRELSGGQKQRVALARTLASEPSLLLLDEPFSALDRRTREELHGEMAQLKQRLSLPVILVTHDFVEAQMLGDRVAVLEEGRVLEVGEKDWIFAHPSRHETARFLGVDNVLPATIAENAHEGDTTVHCGGLGLRVKADPRFACGAAAYLCIHAADVRLLLDGKPRPNTLFATVEGIRPYGGSNRVRVRAGPDGVEDATYLEMVVDDYVLGRHGIAPGKAVKIWLPAEKLFLCE